MNAALLTLMPLLAADGGPFSHQNLRFAGLFVICLIIAIAVHEFAHAFAADKLGDGTPEAEGRLTLNPVAHADPIGTLILPLVLTVMQTGFLFGWGRPVNTQPRNYTRKVSMRAGMALVAFAGPLSNLLQAALAIALAAGLSAAGVAISTDVKESPLALFFTLNLVLFMFNLLPIHPLDGGKVFSWAFGAKWAPVDEFLGRYGGIVILVLVLSPIPILGYLLWPVLDLGQRAFAAVL
ncbi:MAG: site-2 protease family protein [Nannocystaceae bacterium]|nr:site-2 protease family protein [bacterium]